MAAQFHHFLNSILIVLLVCVIVRHYADFGTGLGTFNCIVYELFIHGVAAACTYIYMYIYILVCCCGCYCCSLLLHKQTGERSKQAKQL